jgi:hypothetical protein
MMMIFAFKWQNMLHVVQFFSKILSDEQIGDFHLPRVDPDFFDKYENMKAKNRYRRGSAVRCAYMCVK